MGVGSPKEPCEVSKQSRKRLGPLRVGFEANSALGFESPGGWTGQNGQKDVSVLKSSSGPGTLVKQLNYRYSYPSSI